MLRIGTAARSPLRPLFHLATTGRRQSLLAVALGGLLSIPAGALPATVPVSTTAGPVVTYPSYPANAPATGPFHVVGNRIENGAGQPFFVHGVDRPSLEWSCSGQAVSGAPGIPASDFSTMHSSWHANAVRISLNQDFWLSSAGMTVAPSSNCPNYISTVKNVVANVEANHMVAILDLHWSDRGNLMGTPGQQQMPDQNSITFWRSVASTFSSNAGVMFELYNEPHDVSWSVWRNGGTVTAPSGSTYQAAGMQQLLDAVRGAGASNVVLAGGLNWAYDLSGVLNGSALSGTNVAYATHPYAFKSGTNPSAWQAAFGQVAESHPVVATEFGDTSSTVTPYDSQILSFFDSHGIGYTGWAWWNGGNNFPSLISNANGQCYLGGCNTKADMTALAAGSERVTVPTLTFASNPPSAPAPPQTPIAHTVTTTPVSISGSVGTTPNWSVAWGGRSISTTPISTGAVIGLHSAGYGAISSGSEPLNGLAPGDTVNFVLGNFTGDPVQVIPFGWARSWTVHFAAAQTVSPGWSSMTWTVPAMSSGLGQIGLQVNNGAGYVAQLELSHVTFSAPAAPAVTWTMPSTGKSITWNFVSPTWNGYQGWSQSWDTPDNSSPTYLTNWGWLWPWVLPSGTHRVILTFFTNGHAASVSSPTFGI